MRERALECYQNGRGCSQSLLAAFEETFSIPVSGQVYDACNGMNTGFGIGGMCGAVIAGLMLFGLLFDDSTARRLRMVLFSRMAERGLSFDCVRLRQCGGDGCEELIGDVAELVEGIIRKEKESGEGPIF